MKKLLNYKLLRYSFVAAFIATSLFFTSCADDGNDVFRTEDDEEITEEESYQITVNPTNADTEERSVEIVAEANSLVQVKVSFTGDNKMRRIYLTKNIFSAGLGAQPYEYELGSKKSDGSIDLDGEDKTAFDFTFNFDAPSEIDDVVQYVIWTTNNKGDFRDISDSNSIADDAYGTITIKAGENADTNFVSIASFSATILAAPTGDGNSETFLSIFNGENYKIVQQAGKGINASFTETEKIENAELSALWDFGYFYGVTKKASFVSASRYMEVFANSSGPIVDITNFTGLVKADLNSCYFAKSSLTAAEFDGATDATLSSVIQPSEEVINDLQVGDVVEFVDAYGSKGLIKVTRIKGTYNQGDEIQFDVKVQIKAEALKL